MNKLLIKLFIKNNQDIKNPKVRRSYGTLAAVVGIVSNVFIFILKVIIGLVTASISILADAINSISDAASSIISLIGFKLSAKPGDKEHPFGHARIEYLAGFIVSIIIIVLGIQLVISSIGKIITPDPVMKDITWIVVILLISIAVKIYQALFNYSIGKTISSSTIKATAVDSRNDVISTSVVLIGLIVSRFINFNLDGYLGALVGLFVCISGFKLVLETAKPLVGQQPEPETINAFVNLILSHEEVLGIHDLQMHCYGANCVFASCHVELDASIEFLVSHDLVDNIERECFDKLKIHTVLHMDPVTLNDPKTNKIKEEVKEILQTFPFSISMHDFRIVTGPTHTNIVFDIVVPLNKVMKDDVVVKQISQKIKDLDSTYFPVITVDQAYSDFSKNN